jgi:hypothetical protein
MQTNHPDVVESTVVDDVAAAQGRWKYYHGPQMMSTILYYCLEQNEALRSRVEKVRNERTIITTNPTATTTTTTTTNNDGSGGRWNGYRVSC